MKINEIITEVFNPETSFPIEWDDHFGPKEMHGRAYDRQGGYIDIKFVPLSDNTTEVEFSRNDSYDVTGGGDANRVLGTILEAFREYLRGHQPKIFVFSAKGGSRSKVYQSMINRFAQSVGYKQFDTSKLSPEKRAKLAASGTDLMVLRRAAVAEAFDQPYKSKWAKGEFGDFDVVTKLPDGTNLSIMFNNEGDDEWQVEFYRNNSQEVTGEGDAQRIFATVLATIQKFIKKHKPQQLTFSATKDVEPDQNSESRAKLYNRLVDRYATSWGYDALIDDLGDQVEYELTRLQPVTEEEFNGIDIDMDIEGDEIMVTAMGNGRELGHVLFVDEGEYLMPQDLEVDERFQGQGIAAAMYDYVKSKGYKIRRSGQQTDAGAGFWGKHRPEQNVWEGADNGAVEELRAALVAKQDQLQSATDDQVYNIIDRIMTRIARNHGISGKKLHDMWVDTYKQVPDTWIMKENFADGRVKGRSRPGRVKRAGASCSGSVTDLRARAKNASGEKAKMYHWCANMKSGRKK